ncbi:MAG: hypothetical protein EXR55_02970 [Dehalococcoidia bacterium]|nr:hypothetical protein [Dehalococcoidia bacterium]
MLRWFQEQSFKARVAWLFVALVGVWFLGSCASGVFYDRDCRDFSTHADAQRVYHLTGGPVLDFHHRDGDRDGIACESLRGAPKHRGSKGYHDAT